MTEESPMPYSREMTQDELAFLGRVVVTSALLESKLDWAIPAMLKISGDVYEPMVVNKTIGPKVALYSAVLNNKIKNIRTSQRKTWATESVGKFLRLMNECVAKRNVVVHGLWSPGGHGDSLWVYFTQNLDGQPIAAKSGKKALKVFASELSALAGHFEQLTERVSGAYWEFFVSRTRKRKPVKKRYLARPERPRKG